MYKQHDTRKILGIIIQSRVFMIGSFLIFCFITYRLSVELMREYKINKEIKRIQADVKSIENKNKELLELIEYLKTDAFREKNAREKLGLKKPGETVVAIPNVEKSEESIQNSDSEEIIDTKITSHTEPPDERTNPRKWYDYFFAE